MTDSAVWIWLCMCVWIYSICYSLNFLDLWFCVVINFGELLVIFHSNFSSLHLSFPSSLRFQLHMYIWYTPMALGFSNFCVFSWFHYFLFSYSFTDLSSSSLVPWPCHIFWWAHKRHFFSLLLLCFPFLSLPDFFIVSFFAGIWICLHSLYLIIRVFTMLIAVILNSFSGHLNMFHIWVWFYSLFLLIPFWCLFWHCVCCLSISFESQTSYVVE